MKLPQAVVFALLCLNWQVGIATNLSSARVNELWALPRGLLEQPLWMERDAYDAAHYLMVPLQASFQQNRQDWIADFDLFFLRFSTPQAQVDFLKLGLLNQLQFMYLATEYLALHAQYGSPAAFSPKNLLDRLEQIWTAPAWIWSSCGAGAFKTMRQRLEWKLSAKPAVAYCKGIFDEEWFVAANAANLAFVLGSQTPSFILDILALSYTALSSAGSWNPAYTQWLLEPGIWSRHPDFAYAGWVTKVAGLDPKPVDGISLDTSHSHRFPLWLLSLERGYRRLNQKPQAAAVAQILSGFSQQFLRVALVPPSSDFPSYRTTNYLDGSNGLYRYRYQTQAAALGYGPYELSGTLLLGWWAFLPSPEASKIYCELAQAFPFSSKLVEVYLGPDTSRARHPLLSSKQPFENGLLELISRLACEIKSFSKN